MQRLIITCLIILTLSCSEAKDKNKFQSNNLSLTDWFLKNEASINRAVNQLIIDDINDFPEDSNYLEKAIVVTKNASSILGTFAQKVSGNRNCIFISYTFSKDTLTKKKITFFPDENKECIRKIDSIDIRINSTYNFEIIKDNNPH